MTGRLLVAINQAKQVHKTVQVSKCPRLCCKAAPAPVEVVNTMAAAPRSPSYTLCLLDDLTFV